ncbi:MAG: hypothetical protein IBX57_00500 [Gammaproteobacteria bacterium]|nr:hypothetical protein [Gammaproteobacteria bacterium]
MHKPTLLPAERLVKLKENMKIATGVRLAILNNESVSTLVLSEIIKDLEQLIRLTPGDSNAAGPWSVNLLPAMLDKFTRRFDYSPATEDFIIVGSVTIPSKLEVKSMGGINPELVPVFDTVYPLTFLEDAVTALTAVGYFASHDGVSTVTFDLVEPVAPTP